jgi:hypothetical protein
MSLWGLATGNPGGENLIWQISPGKQLVADFDYRTGMLDVEPRLSSWRGVDTLWVTASDLDGLSDRVPLVFELSDSTASTRQVIALEAGWNLISTNVYPADSSIAGLFRGLPLVEVKNADAFWSRSNPPQANRLKVISAGEAYLVKMDAADSLVVTGKAKETHGNVAASLSIRKGPRWQLLGCPFQSPVPLSILFDTTGCRSIKNFDGFWKPGGSINSLQNMVPGKGYFVQFTE